MRTTSNKDSIYLGKGVGGEIMGEIKRARKSVKIVSPYLSGSYVKELIELHKKGVEITLVTSDNITEGNDNRYSDFKPSELVREEREIDKISYRKRKEGMRYSLIGLFFSFILISLSYVLITLLIPGLIILIISFMFILNYYFTSYEKIRYIPIFKIKVFDSASGDNPQSTELIHSKIFVIDEKVCYLGSANFTYSGFKKHYETVVKIEDIDAVRDISGEVENLFDSKILREKSVEEWVY